MAALKIIVLGTAELACPSLDALSRSPDFQVSAVVTQPDRPQGRALKRQPSPVKVLALERNLPVRQPERARHADFIAEVKQMAPDLMVVAAYGQILPQALLDVPPHGCLNVHASLLPKYRGAAPIQWALLDNEPQTGVTIMKLDAGLDTGPVLAHAATPISPADNAQTLHDRLARMGAELLLTVLPDYVAGKLVPRPQPAEGASYARKITREDGHLDWTLSALQLWNRVRAFTPWPGSYAFHPAEPKPWLLKIWSARVEPQLAGPPGQVLRADKSGLVVACGAQALRLLELQPEGGRRMSAMEFLAGHPLAVGTVLQ